jgi:small-conductance mechanosensitive channel
LQDFFQQTQAWAQLIGPNKYLQATAIIVAFVLVGKIADLVISRVIGKLVSRSSTDVDDSLVALVHRPVFVTFVLLGLALGTDRLQLPETPQYLTLGVLKTIAIVVWYGFFSRITQILITAFSNPVGNRKIHEGMLVLFNNASKVAIFALAVYFIFLAWNIDVTAWLASAGIVGLALSFAAKDTLSNLFAGVSIVADAPYKIGDFIILDTGERGMVSYIGLRSTRLITRDDVEITIPNGIIGNTKIINEAGGPSEKHRIRIPIGIAYGSDIDDVITALAAVAEDHDEVCKTPAPRVRFRSFGESNLDFELLCWIDRPVDRGRMLHELNCAVYKKFQKEDIKIPFPQRDIYLHTASDGLT